MSLHDRLSNVGAVLRQTPYLVIAGAVSLTAFVFYALLLDYELLLSLFHAGDFGLITDLLPILFIGYLQTTALPSLALNTLIAIGIGVNAAMVVYRLVELAEVGRESVSSLSGMAVAVVAPACPACATTLFAFAGLSSTFALLPFNGAEFKAVSLALLTGSALWIAAQLQQDVCDLC